MTPPPYVSEGGQATLSANGIRLLRNGRLRLQGAGLLDHSQVPGQPAHYGDADPGRRITNYATDEHRFIVVEGSLRQTQRR